jgi:hypothetical protein
MLAQYYTAEQIATVLDVDIKRVWDWKRAGLIAPALTKGEEQYARGDVLKLAVLLALKDVFGEKHGAPARIVSAHGDELHAFSATLGVPGREINIRLSPTTDVEIRVKLADAIREKLAAVPA